MTKLAPFFRIESNGFALGFVPAIASATGTGLFLEPESAAISALDNPVVIPDSAAVRALLPLAWRAAFDRISGRFWHVSKPASLSAYFDSCPLLDVPSMTLYGLRGQLIARVKAVPVRIAPDIAAAQIDYRPVNYSGHAFTDLEPRKDSTIAPGWFIFGRNAEKYGTLPNGNGAYVALVARPCGHGRKSPNYNGEIAPGYPTRAMALAAIETINRSN